MPVGEGRYTGCPCCVPPECTWCNEGYGIAPDVLTVTFSFTPTAGLGTPECANCADYGSTAYDITKIDDGTKCRWQGAGECDHLITYEHVETLDGDFLVLKITSADENTTYASWRYETYFGNPYYFNCNEESLPMTGGTIIFSSTYGASPANWINNFFVQSPCEGAGNAIVDYNL